MTLEHFKPNEIIVRQNDPGDSFFYILTGTVNIKINKQIKTGISGKNSNITVEVSNVLITPLAINRFIKSRSNIW